MCTEGFHHRCRQITVTFGQYLGRDLICIWLSYSPWALPVTEWCCTCVPFLLLRQRMLGQSPHTFWLWKRLQLAAVGVESFGVNLSLVFEFRDLEAPAAHSK